jgi:hypothetical protein
MCYYWFFMEPDETTGLLLFLCVNEDHGHLMMCYYFFYKCLVIVTMKVNLNMMMYKS